MDLVYDALDAANMAGKTAFGVDLELEAISEGFLGKIHYKGLKNSKRAKTNFLNCIRMAHKMHPRVVQHLDWYKLAETQLQEIRDKQIDTETEENQRERQPLLDQLKTELETLAKFTEKGCRPLLEHLNEKHCPNKIDLTDESFQMHRIKKTVLKFL